MRKYISMIMFAAWAVLGFSACDTETDEKPGGTNVVKMAGFWDVSVDELKDDGSVNQNLGDVRLRSYNTVANESDRMWLNMGAVEGGFSGLKLIVPINYTAKTFSCEATQSIYNKENSKKVTITDGKVLLGKGHNLHGLPTDSIVFTARFDDNKTYRIAGIRHSGFTE